LLCKALLTDLQLHLAPCQERDHIATVTVSDIRSSIFILSVAAVCYKHLARSIEANQCERKQRKLDRAQVQGTSPVYLWFDTGSVYTPSLTRGMWWAVAMNRPRLGEQALGSSSSGKQQSLMPSLNGGLRKYFVLQLGPG
jgi:hypothetical protein